MPNTSWHGTSLRTIRRLQNPRASVEVEFVDILPRGEIARRHAQATHHVWTEFANEFPPLASD
jgi:hypothetical protein